jgi:hypothetical protein
MVPAALVACAALAAAAQAQTFATITASLSPNRPDARAALTLTMHFADREFGVPVPLRRSVLHLPGGLTLDVPHLRGCNPRRLRQRGPASCPAQSKLGVGHAFVEARAGSLILSENVALWAFLGVPLNLQPTFEILGQGRTPLDERVVFTGTVLPDRPPYGEELVMSVPAIPTLPLEPNASLVNFSLTIGAAGRRGIHGPNAVVIRGGCPVGGFPFADQFTYADGSSGEAYATAPCP